MKAFLKLTILLLLAFLLMFVTACQRRTSPASPDLLPNTTLANIPIANDTLFALVTLYWDGEDNDGYIAGFQYRYITRHLFKGDSVVQNWKETKKTSLTIPFESSDSLNYQRFQVRAIDNKGGVDPTPAEKSFYTRKTIPPTTKIISPQNDQQFFAIDHTTDWWQGIQLNYTASDKDGKVVEYAWAIDNGDWNWTQDTTLYITPDQFNPLEGKHTIRVTARDNTNLIDLKGASATITLIKPTFNKKILIVDETDEKSFPFGVNFTDEDVDHFYADIYGTRNSWDFIKRGMPPKDTLGQYQLVVWHADNSYSSPNNYHKLPDHIADIEDYLNVGGNFIMSGWRILKSFAPTQSFPLNFEEGTFVHDYLHINIADETPLVPSDFTGAVGVGNFSDIKVDSVKLADAFPYFGKLAQINIMPARAGFTDIIYTYKNANDSPFVQFRGRACGLRYYGTSFNVVVLGFPVFFIQKQDAKILASQILHSLGF